jgi:2-polyprenyl-3-methyl-5-hydroxy-6-metoxy-1,4-benzoquinol methylase
MKDIALARMHSSEDSWWYRGRRRAAATLLWRFVGVGTARRILDVGAGYGAMRSPLDSFGTVDAFEPDGNLLAHLSEVGYAAVYGTWEDVAREGGRRYGIVGAFDVIEHAPDESDILRHVHDALADDGMLIVSVPAYRWLWSKHDDENKHYRRYTARMLRRSLHAAGFEVTYISYWNTVLFPLAAAARLLGFVGDSTFGKKGRLDALFGAVVSVEAWLMRYVPLPFGLSVFAVAYKRG